MSALDGLRTFAVVLTSLVHLVPGPAPGGILRSRAGHGPVYLWESFVAWTVTPALRHSPWWVPANVVETLVPSRVGSR
jgi:hypothetical protein